MDKKSFEEALKELEGLVEELEKGDLALDQAVKKYEEGRKLSKHCHALLEEAEKALTKKMENGQETDFDMPKDEEE